MARLMTLGILGVTFMTCGIGCASRGSIFSNDIVTLEPTAHRVLVASDGPVMEQELNVAAETGFRLHAVHWTRSGGIIMINATVARHASPSRFSYRVISTSWSDTAQEFDTVYDLLGSALETLSGPISDAAEEGFYYPGQAIVLTGTSADNNSPIVLDGVLIILERDNEEARRSPVTTLSGFKVLATRRASTMERELNEEAETGCRFQAVTHTLPGQFLPALVVGVGIASGEVFAILACDDAPGRFDYRVFLGQNNDARFLNPRERTERALNNATEEGFVYRAHTALGTFILAEERQLMIFMEKDNADQDETAPRDHLALPIGLSPSALEDALVEASRYGYDVLGIASGAAGYEPGATAIMSRPQTNSQSDSRP